MISIIQTYLQYNYYVVPCLNMLLFLEIIIIIIIYIISIALQSSGARAQKRNKTKSLIMFKGRDHTGVIISSRAPPTIIMLRWENNFEEISFEIFTNKARLSQDFNVVASSFQMMGAATEKARLPRFSLDLGIESCCEVDDLCVVWGC